ncbi:hypothetical protein [Lacipirellula parvula]|uniref:Uncharacterized protein n=1 Tax=Lacipirellula parvula TaxID=2650471 RepID=A0A5K7X978_9BACT|nr:hypothetical protein [Lacipirellula parvula]BBO32915.1 hypothetical protein PLANPX_2527 [Lacipirellula parvula]
MERLERILRWVALFSWGVAFVVLIFFLRDRSGFPLGLSMSFVAAFAVALTLSFASFVVERVARRSCTKQTTGNVDDDR